MHLVQPFGLSRRQFLSATSLVTGAAILGGVGPLARRVWAKQEQSLVEIMRNGAAESKLSVEALRGGVHVIIGSGGNIGVLAGPDGKLLVDGGLAGSKAKVQAELAKLGGGPVKHLVNTHWHFDHTDGNQWLHEDAGATIIAHENTVKYLTHATRVEDWKFTFPPVAKGAVPTEVVKKDHAIKINGTTVALDYYGAPGHTDGDLSAYFPDADVVHTGDTFWNGHYPFIDYGAGGSIGGMMHACEVTLGRITDKTLVIPGHGPVAKKSDLSEFRDTLASVRDAVAKLKKEGKSADEAVAAKPTKSFDEKYGGFVVTPEHMTRLAYAGV
jgi:glyoxylase-like metal-dependent hydrolase (beta-lactamase superfamily II)